MIPTIEPTIDSRLALGFGGRFYGVYPALVIDIVDPDGQGRVKVQLPWSPDGTGPAYEVWARLSTMMAGNNRGSWYIPDVDDEVLVAFEGGDPRRPYMLGMLWNGQDAPPEEMDSAGRNYLKVIRSRNDVKITLDDTDGQEQMILETPNGVKITLDNTDAVEQMILETPTGVKITLDSTVGVEQMTLETPRGQVITLKDVPGLIELKDSNFNKIVMEPSGISVTTPLKLTVEALAIEATAATIEATAATVKVNAPISEFSGVVKAKAVITKTAISESYLTAPFI